MENEFTESQLLSLKNNIKDFYYKNKLLFFSIILFIIIIISSTTFYFHSKKDKKLMLADLYVKSKIDLLAKKNLEAKKNLIKIIQNNDQTYSALSLFLIIDHNLIEDDEKIVDLFDHILKNNKFEKEIRNLVIFKKALVQANFVNEAELIENLNPLINSETLWKSHALLLLGDYFHAKEDFLKAKENYLKILSLSDVDNLHEQAKFRLQLNSYE